MKGIYSARRIDNGEIIEGNLICKKGSPFCYILTNENFDHMIVDELNNGFTYCSLIRVMEHTVKRKGK